MGVLSFLLSGPGLAGLAIAGALAVAGVQTWRLHSCQADIAAQREQVAILGASLAEQNRAVEALRTEGIRRQATAAQALAKAEGRAKVWDEQAKRLQAALTARKPTDSKECKDAWQELRK